MSVRPKPTSVSWTPDHIPGYAETRRRERQNPFWWCCNCFMIIGGGATLAVALLLWRISRGQ